MKKHLIRVEPLKKSPDRRQFLKLGGMGILGAGLLVACHKDDNDDGMMMPPPGGGEIFDLGEGDLGVLNYAYALEQLEADFYTKVVNSFYGNISDEEKQVLTDIYNHEVNHRDFFMAAITAAVNGKTELMTPTLEFDYGNLDFGNRDQVLGTARVLEDTGVAAYNGAGKLLANPDYLLIAGKIVSVEARHASAIRTLLNPGSADFAGDDVVNVTTGLDVGSDPSAILTAVGATGFVKTPFTANKLP